MLRFTVRFDRYTQENQDDDYANERFHYIPTRARRLLEQMRAELGQNDKLAGLWDTYFSRIINDNLFCVWVGFDWPGDGPSFFRTMQETYDVHGMSGDFEVIDVAGPGVDNREKPQRELLVKWCGEANQPADLPCIYELDDNGEATGSVNFYCSQECYEAGKDDHAFERSSPGTTPRNALCEGAQCYQCSKEL